MSAPIVLELRSTDGEPIEVTCAEGDTSTRSVLSILNTAYGYPPTTRFLYSGKTLLPDHDLSALPAGSVVVVGRPTPSAAFAAPPPRASPRKAQDPVAPGEPVTPQTPQTPPVHVTVQLPATGQSLHVALWPDATLADLLAHIIAKDPRLVGAKIVYAGRVLDNPGIVLKAVGVVDGSTVHCASGAFKDPQAVLLFTVREKAEHLETLVSSSLHTFSDTTKKGYYEEAMKLLFSLDNLVDLHADLKAQRKDVAGRLQRLQDTLEASFTK